MGSILKHVSFGSIDPHRTNVGLPVPEAQEKRTHLKYEANETPATGDITQEKYSEPANTKTVVKTDALGRSILKDPVQLVQSYEEAIDQHVERRVAFFFQQLVDCYCTQLHFEIGQTMHQLESSTALHVNVNGEHSKISKRNAAHSSTLPCLYAYDGKEWEKDPKKAEGFVYIYKSDHYRLWNATMSLPKVINDADSMIDGKALEGKLRTRSLEIINQVSKGTIDPQKGTIKFLTAAIQITNKNLQKTKEGKKKALEFYVETLNILKEEAQDEEFFDRMLDVSVAKTVEGARLRKIAHHIRYAAIRQNQLNQTDLLQKIEKISTEVFKNLNKSARQLPNYSIVFHRTLIEKMSATVDQQRLGKLLGYSDRLIFSKDDSRRSREAKQRNYDKTKKAILEESNETVKQLAKKVGLQMRSMRIAETEARAKILKELRTAKQWTQKWLGSRIKRIFPNEPASQSTISRTERGERFVTPGLAKKLSSVFDVDPGLFTPHFFYA